TNFHCTAQNGWLSDGSRSPCGRSVPTAASGDEAVRRQSVRRAPSHKRRPLTGALTLSLDPAAPLQAATKQYVDTQTGTPLPRSGGALTGALTLPADPVQPLQPATKQYVDALSAAVLPKAGGTMNGPVILASD